MKLLISFATYPRRGKITFDLLQRTFSSLITNDISIDVEFEFEFIIVGDDYPNIEELSPIFNGYKATFYNINQNNALRKEKIAKEIIWSQAVQRSKIFILEKALETDFNYILMSSDDDEYLNNKISTSLKSIEANNYPDFIFNLGIYTQDCGKEIILPRNNSPYPEPQNCISSGCIYKLTNKQFICDIINFRKQCWFDIELYINAYKNNNTSYINIFRQRIKPEDYQLWAYLGSFFKNNIYTSLLIPKVLIHHGPERTLFNYI
jgi:hypothetical protein